MQYNIKRSLAVLTLVFSIMLSNAQLRENNIWRALFMVGANFPSESGFVDVGKGKSPNLPTINLGIQRMFKAQFGARLDYSFNRLKNDDNAPEFKINYSRINIQFVYDPSENLGLLSERTSLLLHAGPGFSFAKPLSGLSDNKQSYLNVMAGLELQYALSRKVALVGDVSYILGLSSLENYDPLINGLGAFNGNLLTATVGISLALSGCYTCN